MRKLFMLLLSGVLICGLTNAQEAKPATEQNITIQTGDCLQYTNQVMYNST